MYLKQIDIAYNSTGADPVTATSTQSGNGVVYGVQHVGSAAVPTTAAITLSGATRGIAYLTGISIASTNNQQWYPRGLAIDTTGQTIGTSTDWAPIGLPVLNENLSLSIAGATSDGVSGTVIVMIEGS